MSGEAKQAGCNRGFAGEAKDGPTPSVGRKQMRELPESHGRNIHFRGYMGIN
jgi:hypothetical protein